MDHPVHAAHQGNQFIFIACFNRFIGDNKIFVSAMLYIGTQGNDLLELLEKKPLKPKKKRTEHGIEKYQTQAYGQGNLKGSIEKKRRIPGKKNNNHHRDQHVQ